MLNAHRARARALSAVSTVDIWPASRLAVLILEISVRLRARRFRGRPPLPPPPPGAPHHVRDICINISPVRRETPGPFPSGTRPRSIHDYSLCPPPLSRRLFHPFCFGVSSCLPASSGDSHVACTCGELRDDLLARPRRIARLSRCSKILYRFYSIPWIYGIRL